jgi:hypothetical protein
LTWGNDFRRESKKAVGVYLIAIGGLGKKIGGPLVVRKNFDSFFDQFVGK